MQGDQEGNGCTSVLSKVSCSYSCYRRAVDTTSSLFLTPVPLGRWDQSIDDDILNLIDEVDLEEVLKEASVAIEDADRLTGFIREKSTIAIERFLVGGFTTLLSQV